MARSTAVGDVSASKKKFYGLSRLNLLHATSEQQRCCRTLRARQQRADEEYKGGRP